MRLYNTKLRQLVILLMISLMFSGCGFHLRGKVDVPSWLNNVAIVIEQANRDLGPLVKEQLQAYNNNIKVSSTPALAKYWLILESDSTQQQITSISSSTTPRQYQLIYTVRFKLQRAKGKEIIPSSQVVVTRQITLNGNRILGSNDEEELIKIEMRQDAVIQIINRMSRAATE